jgi:archaellum component FlaG (FlaF/FlaG flagellin family)
MNPIAKMMKRYVKMPLRYALPLLFICALVLVATTGCTSQNTTQSVVNQSADQAANTTNPISVTIKAAGTSTSIGSYSTPQSGYTYVLYNATVKNNNEKDLHVNPTYFTLRTSDGKVYDVDSAMYDSSINGFKMVTKTQPGDINSGMIVYQIPQGATPKSILYDDYTHKVTTNL